MGEDSNAWVFDSLICFLHGPIWNAPLQTFIEEKSLSEFWNQSNRISIHKLCEFIMTHCFIIVFDPNEKLDENNDEYRKVHEEYKHLVIQKNQNQCHWVHNIS